MIEPLSLTSIPAHAEALRPAVRAFVRDYTSKVPLEQRARSWMGFDADFSRALAKRGWVGVTLPKETVLRPCAAWRRQVWGSVYCRVQRLSLACVRRIG